MENFEELGSENTTFQQGSISGNGGGEPTLKEADRKKLDGIVQKMIQNKESDENIKFVVNDFKKKYGTSQPKGVTTEQNTASQSASVNGGSLSASGDVRPKGYEGLTKKPKTFLQQAEEEQRKRPKIGQEQKIDIAEKATEKAIEKKFPHAKVDVLGKKIDTKVKENYYSNTDVDSRWNDIKQPSSKEAINVFNNYPNLNTSGVNIIDFAQFLKNNTRYFEDKNIDNNNKTESEFVKNKYLQDYIKDRINFLENKLRYTKPEDKNNYNKVVSELNSINDKYENYVNTYLPEFAKLRNETILKQKENHSRIKKGDLSQYYNDAKNLVERFVKGGTNPILDMINTGLDKVGAENLADKLRVDRNITEYKSNMNNITNAKGSVVNYNNNEYVVTSSGEIIDSDTKTVINSFTDKNTINKIYDLTKKSDKVKTLYSGRGYANSFSDLAGNLTTQILLTKGAASAAAKVGLGVNLSTKVGEITSVFGMVGASTYEQTLQELRDAGITDEVAKTEANKIAALTATASAVSSYFMPNANANKVTQGLNTKLLIKESIDVLKKEGKEGLANFLKTKASKIIYNSPDIIKEGGGEFLQEILEGKAQYIANQNANTEIGKQVLQEGFKEGELLDTFILSATAGSLGASLGKAKEGAFGMDIKENFEYLSNIDINKIDKIGNNLVNSGDITQEEFTNLKNQVLNYRNNKSKLPSNIKGKKAVDATQLIAERENLKQQRKNLDEVFHPEIDAKIESINNQLKGVLSQPETTEDTTGTGKSTQEFFGTVVKGGDERYTPSKSYEYEQEFTPEQDKFRKKYDDKKGNFDEHIATSIPTFRETQVKKGNAIIKMLEDVENPVVYDLGGSEGSWVKTITEESGGKIKTINLDPSPEMKEAFDKNKPENSEMSLEAFYSGWDDVPTHKPKEKADVVHESMMFQFIENKGDRKQYIDEVADKYLKEDGVFITEEKFKMNTDEEYVKNEKLKESHKNKYYTPEQQSLKSDEVLVGMKENQANFDQYVKELQDKFKYVKTYWKSGNFRGIIATNNESKLNSFLENLGETSNKKYNWEKPYDKNEVSEIKDAKQFVDAQKEAMSKRKSDSKQVDILSEKDAQKILDEGGKLFMTNDGKSGAYVKADGYMGGLFKDPTAGRSEAAKVLQEVRIEHGGKFFDAFGTHLEDIYVKNGFKPVVRMDFNEEFAPEGWKNTNLKDKPDNVFFVYAPESNPKIGEGVRINNYEKAYEIAKNYEPNQTTTTTEEVTVPNQEGKNTGNDEVLRTNIESPAKYKNYKGETVEGVIKLDGQTVTFETPSEKYELGNIDEIGDSPLSDLRITLSDKVSLTEDGNIEVRGKKYINNYSDAKQAINYDSDGNVISVNLETESGEKRTFRGQVAEDIAYQITASGFTKAIEDNVNIESKDEFDKFIGGIDNLIKKLDDFTKGTLGAANIIPSVAKGALKIVKATAIATRDTVTAINAGIDYIKTTDWYKNLTKDEKVEFDKKSKSEIFDNLLTAAKKETETKAEKLVDTVTIPNKKSTKATIRQNTGQTDTSPKVTTTESKLLKEKFKNLQRGFKEGVKETKQMKRDFIEQVKSSIKGLGSFITEQDAKTILNQVANVNDKNIDKISEVIDNLVSRLENRANKAKINKLAKMQRKAKVKARTKYGNAGEDINKLIKLPANQIPEAYFDRYFDLMQKLSKGEPVNFNEVTKLYSDLKTEIESFIDRKNNATKDKKEPDVDKVNEAKSKLKNEIYYAKLSTPKNKLTDFEKRVLKSFFEIPDSYLDQLSLTKLNELNKALDYFISTGYMPNKVLSDFVMKYKSEQTTSNIINKVGDVVLKPVLSITGMIDKIKNKGFTSDDFFKNIQNNMLHHIDSTIKGIKGTLFYDNIVHPITSNFNKSDSETNKIGREVAEKLNAASKSEGSGFKVNVRLQMFFRQREFESNPELRGDKVFSLDDHMLSMKENENSLDYTKDDLDLIYQMYDEMKGKSSDEMLNMMTKEEKDLIDYMDKKLKEQEISSRDYNNHLLGETLIYTKDYFPRKASFTDNNYDEASEIKARLFGMTGATSVRADSSNQRTANKANPLDFNSVANFMTNIRQSNIEKNLAFPVKQTLMTISNLKKSNDKSMITLANALEKTVKNLIEAQLGKNPYSYDSKGEQLFNKFTRNSVTRMLVDPIRLIYDVVANYPTVYGAFIDKLPAIKKASSNITNEVSSEIYKNISSTQSERVGGTASSDYKNAMTTPISKTSNRKAKVSPVEALVDLYKNNKLSDFSENAGNLYYQIADLPARHLWKYYLSEEFRNITGNEFDGKKYLSDKNYREEVQESLQKAATSADKKTANYFNTGASSEQKLKIQGTKNNFLTRVNNFLRSFTFNENRVFWDSLKGMTGFGNTTFDSKSEAMRAFFVINARGITYSYLGSVIGQYLVDFVTGDDEEEKEMIDKKALKRSIGQHAALIALGNKGMIANFIGMFIGEQINARIVEEEKGKYNPYEDNMFYVPNNKSKYTDFLNNLGAEGAAIKTVVDFGSVVFNIYEKIESGEEVTKEDLVRYKAARHSVSLVSQATGLPIDRLGRLAQKALDKKYPYKKKNKPKKISDSTWGKY